MYVAEAPRVRNLVPEAGVHCVAPDRGSAARSWASAWLQLWLQLALFAVIRSRGRPYSSAGDLAYGTVANRHERDHGGLAVWGQGCGSLLHPVESTSICESGQAD